MPVANAGNLSRRVATLESPINSGVARRRDDGGVAFQALKRLAKINRRDAASTRSITSSSLPFYFSCGRSRVFSPPAGFATAGKPQAACVGGVRGIDEFLAGRRAALEPDDRTGARRERRGRILETSGSRMGVDPQPADAA